MLERLNNSILSLKLFVDNSRVLCSTHLSDITHETIDNRQWITCPIWQIPIFNLNNSTSSRSFTFYLWNGPYNIGWNKFSHMLTLLVWCIAVVIVHSPLHQLREYTFINIFDIFLGSWEYDLKSLINNGTVQVHFITFPLSPPGNDSLYVPQHAFRSDFVRMNALALYGGIYIDTDAFVVKSMVSNGCLNSFH